MAFHDLTTRVRDLAQIFVARKPGNNDIYARLEKAIEDSINDPNDLALQMGSKETRLHTALIILESPHLHEAIGRIARERKIQNSNAKQATLPVLQILGDIMGPAYMNSINALRLANGRYVPATKEEMVEFSKESLQKIPENLRPIMEQALIARYTKPESGGVEVGPKMISFVMMQLMPPSPEKYFKLNAAFLKTKPEDKNNRLSNSARIVREIAQKIGVSIPLEFLVDTQEKAKVHKSNSPFGKEFHQGVQPDQQEDSPLYVDLRSQLIALTKRGFINQPQALVYFQLHHPENEKAITKEAVCDRFSLSIAHIIVLERHVESCLDLLEREGKDEVVEFPKNPQPNMVINRGPSVQRRAPLTARSG